MWPWPLTRRALRTPGTNNEDPADLDVLTPSHFLTDGQSVSFIEPDVTKLNFNRLDSWQRVSFLQQSFWSRWKEEYLSLLQQRSKWRASGPALVINDVVLVKDENLPPIKWPLARILDLVTGQDGVPRVAVVRTASGTTNRAVTKLCLLPLKDEVEGQASTGGRLLYKAKSLFTPQRFQLVKSFLEDHIFHVSADGYKLSTVLSTTYADDTAVLTKISIILAATFALQEYLDAFHQWAMNWNLAINADKCANVTFTNCRSTCLESTSMEVQSEPFLHTSTLVSLWTKSSLLDI
ncbi:uncharacterized protein LOC123257369 [Drosophila ananassae]|uniref:uncharacterized protein LOC123257369 n=1 Tax=Drosophila ananassae TaxID=7217 RepID=UPI001CFFC184|nr:uncharacterized protein LOC123257369 [Drosophila ananassae]